MKTISLAIALTFIGTESNAQMQVKNPDVKSVHALGGSLGYTIGSGIAYKYSPSKFSVQLSFAPYKNENYYRYAAGLSFYYKLVDNKKVDFFIYEGNHFITSEEKRYITNTGSPNYDLVYKTFKEDYMNIGLGFGFEFLIKERISLNFMAGYASLENFKKIQPTGEVSIFYNF